MCILKELAKIGKLLYVLFWVSFMVGIWWSVRKYNNKKED